ncbi:hypothetical protein N8E89_05085 [Phyllobacterium sp. A18/5-2]|jgi:hypothetical protein|uniref:hypothetical protein n=1 Tax=Phyllobacterium sp. A18/5-2 TaxID=2978392 RepID=UPI0021CA198B|nr:hypothetical protein [Phyllobacterium sp. A18/5-2]UXN65096.1 hypothetical protein N8E89_05085 [Phyllobacterium sp. A18/5-2]
MESFANPDEFVGNLLSLQADSLALIALYDQDDVLPYANRSLRAAYNIPPDEQLSEGVRILERVFTRIRSARPLKAWPEFSYTCSAGVTALRSGDTAPEFFRVLTAGCIWQNSREENRINVV